MSPSAVVNPASTSLITAKLADLRSHLQQHRLDGYFIPSADEHLNEYLPAAKQRRQWASGFTGSSGDYLIGTEKAWVFVDSRYYEQAELEVDISLIHIAKVGLDDHKTLEETLEMLGREAMEAGRSFRLGFDPFTVPVKQFHDWETKLTPWGIELVAIPENLVDAVRQQAPWSDDPFPAYGNSPVFSLDDGLTGSSVAEKLQKIREDLTKQNVHTLTVTKLDQIAWLFNLRGWDVSYNPVFIAYAIVTPDQAFLFTTGDRIPADVIETLQTVGVTVLPYADYATVLTNGVKVNPAGRVLVDPKRSTTGTYQLVKSVSGKIAEIDNPIEGMKARKNAVEIAQMQAANLKASRAKTRTMKWLRDREGQRLTETEIATTIESFYREEADFQGLSFNTIAGAGANSSIVHYGTPKGDRVVQAGEFLLLDSGSQYAGGTTDDTRTFIVGTPTAEQIKCYTEVLKAHINCAMQRFPKGTTGAQLDGITRSTLWFAGLDYGHGTGHGVGAFLNVHEGPNGISKRVHTALEPGMVTSIEPGYYKPGWGGIRLENLYVIQEIPKPESNGAESSETDPTPPWYRFESLTYIPFDRRLIDLSQLNAQQRQWLETYYQQVIEKLSPTLSSEEITWLKSECSL